MTKISSNGSVDDAQMIQTAREVMNWSREEFASKVRVSEALVADWEERRLEVPNHALVYARIMTANPLLRRVP